jgi:predicted RNA binding protein YcfA (HicA-like mRNA interferase family)
MSYRRQVLRQLEESGYRRLPKRGKGAHEVWTNGKRNQVVPGKIDDRDFANDIMKQAGISHRFR